MNHHDPYYQQSSSAPSTSGSYSVYTQELNPDSVADDTLPSIVDSDQINPFLDDYYEDSDTKDHHSMSSHHGSNADDDLETLMKETDDMLDIQAQLQMEQLSPIDSVERSRQKRAAAARSRYQRMSENERRLYNQRRRLRQMGVDPNNTNADSETLKAQAKQANAKKAEAARLRYHRMTPEQKREYNQRRTEAFRRRRQEEEMLLSTPAGRISQEALQKAQQIMVRNARKAESARLRYQKMTQEQRKVYNTKRASAKRTRRDDGEDYVEYHHQEYMPQAHDMTEHKIVLDQDHMMHLEGLASPDPNDVIDEDEVVDDEVSQEHMLDVINNVAHPPDEMGIFAQMENEVIRQTKKANATILKQHYQQNNLDGGIDYVSSPETLADAELLANFSSQALDEEDTHHNNQHNLEPVINNQNEGTQVIDEKALHDMVATGLDAMGLPVVVRNVYGQEINSTDDLLGISHGQTVLITQRLTEQKPIIFKTEPSTSTDQEDHVTTTSSFNILFDQIDQPDEYSYEDAAAASVDDEKKKATKARRAERARDRYHRMSAEKRREQNARRALALRVARARDDQLMKIAESTPEEQLDPMTAQAIKDAQERRAKRAEQARSKYRRMGSEEKRKYNSTRDAQRKNRRSSSKAAEFQMISSDEMSVPPQSTSPSVDQVDASDFFY